MFHVDSLINSRRVVDVWCLCSTPLKKITSWFKMIVWTSSWSYRQNHGCFKVSYSCYMKFGWCECMWSCDHLTHTPSMGCLASCLVRLVFWKVSCSPKHRKLRSRDSNESSTSDRFLPPKAGTKSGSIHVLEVSVVGMWTDGAGCGNLWKLWSCVDPSKPYLQHKDLRIFPCWFHLHECTRVCKNR